MIKSKKSFVLKSFLSACALSILFSVVSVQVYAEEAVEEDITTIVEETMDVDLEQSTETDTEEVSEEALTEEVLETETVEDEVVKQVVLENEEESNQEELLTEKVVDEKEKIEEVAIDEQSRDANVIHEVSVGELQEVTVDLIGENQFEILFNKHWKISEVDTLEAANVQFDDSRWRRINLPHDYSIEKPFDASYEAESAFLPGGIAWYRKTFLVPEKYNDKKIIIDFDGVYMDAEVYVNGQKIGTHPYGYTAFAFDITDHLIKDSETLNVIAVRVNHRLPSSRWYSGSGIYRDVTLHITDKVHFGHKGIKVETPDLESEQAQDVTVNIAAQIKNDSSDARSVSLNYVWYDAEGSYVTQSEKTVVLDANTSDVVQHTMKVNQPDLWSVETPYLYELELTIKEGEKVLDQKVIDYGFRYFSFDRETGFSLNGEKMKLKGVSMHHDQGALGAVANWHAISRQLDILKEMGVNAIRSTHNPAATALVKLASQKGILVINEAFDGWSIYKNGNVNDFSKFFNVAITEENTILNGRPGMTWAEYAVKSMILSTQNEPSVIMWSIGNEITEGAYSNNFNTYVDIAKNIIKWIQETDQTRRITIGDNRHNDRVLDQIHDLITNAGGIVGKNYRTDSQMKNYRQNHPNWILYGSETASAIHSRGVYSTFGRDNTNLQMSAYDTNEARVGWGATASESWRRVIENDWNAGEFVWTGFDYLGEPTPWNGTGQGSVSGQGAKPKSSYFGIVDTAGYPKDTYYFYRSVWHEHSDTLHLVPTTWNDDQIVKLRNGKIKVDVFTNAYRVELYLNNQKIGEKTATEHTTDAGYQYYKFDNQFYPTFEVSFEIGELSVKGFDKNGNEITENAVGKKRIQTHGEATQLKATVIKRDYFANGEDLVYFEIDILDANGNLVTNANHLIHFDVSENGELVGVDNGNPAEISSFKASSRKAFNGKVLAIVQTKYQSGDLTITASSQGLQSASETVTVHAVTGEQNFLEGYLIPKYVIVPKGGSYDFPTLLHGIDNYGNMSELSVTWSNTDTINTSEEGTYIAQGKIDSLNTDVQLKVYVLDEIGTLENYSTATKVNIVPKLPEALPVYSKSGKSSIEVPVTWDLESADFSKVGIVEVVGSSQLFNKTYTAIATIRIFEQEEPVNIASNSFIDAPKITNGYVESDGTFVDKGTTAISDSLLKLNNGVNNNGNDTSERWTNWSLRSKNPAVKTYLQFEWEQKYTIQNLKIWHFTDNYSRVPGVENISFEYWDDAQQEWKVTPFSNITQVSFIEGDTPYGFINPIETNKLRIWLQSPSVGTPVGVTEIEILNYVPPVSSNQTAQLKTLVIDGQQIDLASIQDNKVYINVSEVPMIYATAYDNAAVSIVPKENYSYDIVIVSEDKQTTSTISIVNTKEKETTATVQEPEQSHPDALSNQFVSNITHDVKSALESDNYLKKTYVIYPTVKSIVYRDGIVSLDQGVNLVMPNHVDVYTQNRLKQTLMDNEVSYIKTNTRDSSKVNIYLGIKGDGSLAEIHQSKERVNRNLYNQIDAYAILVKDNVISIVGKDTDSVFYGLTTLKHMLAQSELPILRNMLVEDYADIKNRGFIEGYYGNPWSNEDRASLMKFGGEVKLTQYFFAPKDDPYHNSKWRELYPDEMLEEIRKLAKVGNETKTRYVWTLHPFMSQPVRFDENYTNDFEVIKAKFEQLLEVGVREFGILADDAPRPQGGYDSYNRLMKDLTNWLVEKKSQYEGLKEDMIFVPHEYWGKGNEAELRALNSGLPKTSSLTLTGGKIWGEVSQNFLTKLKENLTAQNQPYHPVTMWINWPCTDNAKKHLILGGGEKFLHANVDPKLVGGVILNPMQQAEPSKIALFSAAEYTWTKWTSDEEAKSVNNIAFNLADNGTFFDTDTSVAFRELGKHMIHQNMDTRVVALQESVELAPTLQTFLTKLENKEDVTNERDELYQTFKQLKAYAQLYKEQGHPAMRNQIIYWLNNIIDQMDAGMALLEATKYIGTEDISNLYDFYHKGYSAYEQSKTYAFWYVNHYEYAEFGVQHIKPFMQKLLRLIANEVEVAVDPSKVYANFITNRVISVGDIENVTDKNLSTEIIVKSPSSIFVGDYVGLQFSKVIDIDNVHFAMGRNGNLNDSFKQSKLQYLNAEGQWIDVEGELEYNNGIVSMDNMNIKANAIRLIATEGVENIWLGVREIEFNKEQRNDNGQLAVTFTHSDNLMYKLGKSAAEAIDLDKNSETMLSNASGADNTPKDAWVMLTLPKETLVSGVYFAQGSGDKIDSGILEYSLDNENWTKLADLTGDAIVSINEVFNAKYIRVTNNAQTPRWWRVKDFSITSKNYTTDFTDTNVEILKTVEGIQELNTFELLLNKEVTLLPNTYIGLDLKDIYEIKNITHSMQLPDSVPVWYSPNGVEWYAYDDNNVSVLGRYVRLLNTADQEQTLSTGNIKVVVEAYLPPILFDTSMEISSRYGNNDVRRIHNLADLFDGKLNRMVELSDFQKEGSGFTIKLGKARAIRKIKAYIQDGTQNYMRDGVIEVSEDGVQWHTVVSVGDGQENARQDDSLSDGWTHDSNNPGNRYIQGELSQSVQANYIRVRFTANYNHRFIAFSEFEINDGEYEPTVYKPALSYSDNQIQDHEPYRMIDQNILSSFKASQAKGELIYKLSQNTNHNHIRIMSHVPENAILTVSARIVTDDVDAMTTSLPTSEWVTLGIVEKSLETLVLPENAKHLVEIKLSWENGAPTISEVVTFSAPRPTPQETSQPTVLQTPKSDPSSGVKVEVKTPTVYASEAASQQESAKTTPKLTKGVVKKATAVEKETEETSVEKLKPTSESNTVKKDEPVTPSVEEVEKQPQKEVPVFLIVGGCLLLILGVWLLLLFLKKRNDEEEE